MAAPIEPFQPRSHYNPASARLFCYSPSEISAGFGAPTWKRQPKLHDAVRLPPAACCAFLV
jgi:hypothetical protein